MPKCRNCNAPIFFLSEKPRWFIGGTSQNPTNERTDPRPVPIDVDPSPAGTVAIFEDPNPDSVYRPHGKDFVGVRKKYICPPLGLCFGIVQAAWRRRLPNTFRFVSEPAPQLIALSCFDSAAYCGDTNNDLSSKIPIAPDRPLRETAAFNEAVVFICSNVKNIYCSFWKEPAIRTFS